MVISRTPFRISFFGGGTDYPAWYRQHGGSVLGTTIDKYCYLTCRFLPPFFQHKIRIVYSQIENCHSLDEIAHPAVREILRYLDMNRGLEIHHDGDLPARSGMGSSSSFTVGLLHALYALKGQMPNRQQLAKESIHVEQTLLKETVGCQDQVLAAYGGFNHINFLPNGDIRVRPITVSPARLVELNSHLMLFFTGIERTASQIAEVYANNVDANHRELRLMQQLVEDGISILNGDADLTGFGELLREAWEIKRSMSANISNGHVDALYRRGIQAGAIGGKLLGAGGGGFLLLFASPDRQAEIRQELSELIYVPFNFEFAGSQIIFFDREVDYSAEEKAREMRSFAPA
ncbi:MAG TPA: kinase [Candidatus Binatia bacterium]|jgi:D-glycero-alpha-D-manno-heptose-7-phosphate kinase